jgi:hypothetical protein
MATVAESEPGGRPDATEARRFTLRSVAIDVRSRARRVAGWAFIASLGVMVPLAFLTIGMLGVVPLGVVTLWAITMIVPRLRWVGPAPGAIAIAGHALRVTVDTRRGRRERAYALRDLRSGYRTDDEVRLETRRGETLVLGIDAAETGEAVLRALGLDARRRVLEVPLASIASRVPGATALAWLVLLCESPALFVLPIVLMTSLARGSTRELMPLLATITTQTLMVGACLGLVRSRKVAIGMDGIVFRRFFRKRFYPYGAMTDVALGLGGVTLTLRSGKGVRLRTLGFWSRKRVDETAQALFERIETARAAATGPDVHNKLQLLDRRGRTAAAWRAHLGTVLGTSDYRAGAVTARDLAAVIDDAALSAEHRVAATLALRAVEPEEARTRARIAAAACADGNLRAALDHAAEGELDERQLDRVVARGG